MKPIKIILIDDDEDDRFFFEEAIDEISLQSDFWSFNNGVDFLDKLNSLTMIPDIIFLDLNMPFLNGEETLEKIKEIQHLSNIPVIIFSTSLDHDKASILESKGAKYYLQKPPSFYQLKERIERCLKLVFSEFPLNTSQSFII